MLIDEKALPSSNYEIQLEDLLQRICEELQLSRSHYEQATNSYNYVAQWLQGDEVFNNCHLEIYPQGSVRIGTTVKPNKKEEFDVDLVLEIHTNSKLFQDPILLLDQIERRMLENQNYIGKVQRKNRCIQIQYANQYHMDILPAIPTNHPIQDCIKVPDCETQNWKPSNPKGFANWFEGIAEKYVPIKVWQQLLEKSASAKIEDLPDLETVAIKPPLKRAVQLIKHYRNRYFEEQDVKPPISIVLTTLAAQNYHGEGSVYLAILAILKGILNMVNNSTSILKVYNPQNPGELLSERWEKDPEQYEAFKKFIADFKDHWELIPSLEGMGMIQLNKSLGEIIEPTLIEESFKKQATYQQKLRENGKLGLTKAGQVAVLGVGSTSIPKNTFYGT
ncbi:nucleotidyltransferase [Paenibacillus sp. S150]|uniref:nucleotidyltransferase domain-containing protein n=1 Tax=Paenibacillus sp. S150 TaxID=2749826 RepID=UPI001C5728BA|nr:nucleotidyltransferase [Paenibacillus sp. S150]MBW4079995.1 nucleotidyltransferase [Paenibacillus sp. S150]